MPCLGVDAGELRRSFPCGRAESPGEIAGKPETFHEETTREYVAGDADGLAITVGVDASRDVPAFNSVQE